VILWTIISYLRAIFFFWESYLRAIVAECQNILHNFSNIISTHVRIQAYKLLTI